MQQAPTLFLVPDANAAYWDAGAATRAADALAAKDGEPRAVIAYDLPDLEKWIESRGVFCEDANGDQIFAPESSAADILAWQVDRHGVETFNLAIR